MKLRHLQPCEWYWTIRPESDLKLKDVNVVRSKAFMSVTDDFVPPKKITLLEGNPTTMASFDMDIADLLEKGWKFMKITPPKMVSRDHEIVAWS